MSFDRAGDLQEGRRGLGMDRIPDERVTRAAARVGAVLRGKYRIDRLVGVGGMASVYAASHRNGRRVALKILHPEISVSADLRARFLREGLVANAVNHPGAVVVLDDDVAEDGAAFLVMELLEGETVESLWTRCGGHVAAPLVLAIARELCTVLDAAHRADIVHRDLKPENLFITREGQLKVLDFGLARLRTLASPTTTVTGMVFGTPAFMAPEQAAGTTSRVDRQTDLWAVGATMFTLLSGRLVHEGESAQRILVLAATRPARSLASAMPQASPVLVSLVDRALSVDKRARWDSAASMRTAICEVSEALFGEAAPSLSDLLQFGWQPRVASRLDAQERRAASAQAIARHYSSDTPEARTKLQELDFERDASAAPPGRALEVVDDFADAKGEVGLESTHERLPRLGMSSADDAELTVARAGADEARDEETTDQRPQLSPASVSRGESFKDTIDEQPDDDPTRLRELPPNREDFLDAPTHPRRSARSGRVAAPDSVPTAQELTRLQMLGPHDVRARAHGRQVVAARHARADGEDVPHALIQPAAIVAWLRRAQSLALVHARWGSSAFGSWIKDRPRLVLAASAAASVVLLGVTVVIVLARGPSRTAAPETSDASMPGVETARPPIEVPIPSEPLPSDTVKPATEDQPTRSTPPTGGASPIGDAPSTPPAPPPTDGAEPPPGATGLANDQEQPPTEREPADNFPVAPASPPATSSWPTPAPPPATPAPRAAAHPAKSHPTCDPPYTVDGTGKKKWKLECL
jgi:serine/threonine protein kinase